MLQDQCQHGATDRPGGHRLRAWANRPRARIGDGRPPARTRWWSRCTAALSPAEKALAKTPAGAAQVQEFHRQLFTSSSESLRREIKRITGVEVREATAEVETTTGTVVHVFTSGTMVQVFLLARSLPAETWSGSAIGLYDQP